MTQAAAIAGLLGGTAVLGRRVRGEEQLEAAVREGLPAQVLRALAEHTETPLTTLESVVQIDRSTFARRVRGREKLKTDESDRVVRLARVAALAVEAMGRDDGLAWLREPNAALGERVPLDLLATEVGARQVEDVLLRIQHGVYS